MQSLDEAIRETRLLLGRVGSDQTRWPIDQLLPEYIRSHAAITQLKHDAEVESEMWEVVSIPFRNRHSGKSFRLQLTVFTGDRRYVGANQEIADTYLKVD